MHRLACISSAVGLMAISTVICSAQSVTSAHSGTLHYFEGDVSIDGAPVQSKVGRFSEIKEQGVLRTAKGRAEVLLTPGIFLRVGENSAVRMLDNRLVSTRVEILSGTVIVESDDPQVSIKDSPVTLIYKDYEVRLAKHGLLEITSEPAEMKVYKGEAVVDIANAANSNNRATVKEGRLLPFSAALLTEKFNDKAGDDLYLWARDRSQSISTANMSSARSLNSTSSGYGSGLGNWNGGWYFNPYFNMFTFVPAAGTFWNPWGYGFYSPATIYSYYEPGTYWYGGGGARGTGSIGRPLAGVANPSTSRAAPLSTLRGGNSGGVGLGSPIRGGSAIGAGPGFGSGAGSGIGANRGGGDGGFAAPASSGGGFAGGGSRGGGGFSGATAGGGGGGSAGHMSSGGGAGGSRGR